MAATEARSGRGAALSTASANDDWVVQSAETIERVVSTVRSKTTEPVERVARIVVYVPLAVIVGTAALVLLVVGAIRGLDLLIPGEVWSAYAVLGGIFTLTGLFLWMKRNQQRNEYT